MENILIQSPVLFGSVLLIGFALILAEGRYWRFSSHRKIYTWLLVLWALWSSPLAYVTMFPMRAGAHPCGYATCPSWAVFFYNCETAASILMIFCNWLVIYQLFAGKTFFTRPFFKVFSEPVQNKIRYMLIFLLNVPLLTFSAFYFGAMIYYLL